MRSKKNKIGLIVLIAVLMLGIGYAAIANKTLNITGTAGAAPDDGNFKVKFDGTPTTEKSRDTSTVNASVTDDLNGTINVSGLTTTGDKATATFTILNDSPELSAELSVVTSSSSKQEYFKVTTEIAEPKTLGAGGTTTATVTVELIKTPIDNVSSDVTVELRATPVTKS